MVSKATRLADTLEALHNHPIDTSELSSGRTLHKQELARIANTLDITVEPSSPTRADYRAALRTHIAALNADKSPTTTFSTSELLSITRALNTADRLDATDIIPFLEACHAHNVETITVNETPYTVDEYREVHDINAPGYEGYITARFDTNRLIAFYDWDNDGCYYRTSAALEELQNYEPYKEWKKDTYVTSVGAPDNPTVASR